MAVTIAWVTRGLTFERAGGPPQHVRDALCRRVTARWTLIEAFAQGRRLIREGGEEQLILRGVMTVERAQCDLGSGCDISHLHGVVSAFGREFSCRA